jgi:DNA-binding IclR family transcriptional regulator
MLAALPLDQLSSTIAAMRFRSYSATTITDKDRLLECLHEVRKNGFALANQEYDEGIASIGVPVVGSAGNVVGGLCIAAPSYRTSVSELTKWLVPLKRAAREIGSHVTARH